MPYEWTIPPPDGTTASLALWPYRSLPKRGFVIFIAITVAMVALPLLAVIGSPVLWGLLPFIAVAIGGVWWAIQRSYRDGSVLEELTLWPDRITLVRDNPRGPRQSWEANPHWVRVELHPKGGPVDNYLTLTGGSRPVEIGAFLSVEERRALFGELSDCLRRAG